MIDSNRGNKIHYCMRKSAFASVALLSIIIIGIAILHQPLTLCSKAAPLDFPPMTLTIVGLNGEQTVLTEIDIAGLASYRACGGYRNQLGVLKGLGNYTGVPINTFCDLVGGICSGYLVKIMAPDNYSKTMTFEEINGEFATYDNVTGVLVQHNQTLTPILAYYYNDVNVSSSDGPLKVAIVGPEGLCTPSTYWVKQVVRLEIHPILQPMNLSLVALDGTEVVLTESSISNLPATRGVGGYRNQLGIVRGLGTYTGISLQTLSGTIGGMTASTALRVTSPDNYSKTLSYEEVTGILTTYDNVTGQQVPHLQPITPILAYHFNDANLSLSDGPLRLAIVGTEGLATSSTYWVKQAVKLEIRYRNDVAVTGITPSKSIVAQNGTVDISVGATNEGGYDETFTVTAYANQSMIGTQSITLPAGNSTTILFSWNTTGFALGDYELKAIAQKVADEVDTSDNSLTDGYLHVGIPGDINGDGRVDLRDIGYIAKHFGATPINPSWDSACDTNNDGRIDLFDISVAARHFGEHAI